MTRSDLIDGKKMIKIPQLNQEAFSFPLPFPFLSPFLLPLQIPNPQYALPPFLLPLDLVIIVTATSLISHLYRLDLLIFVTLTLGVVVVEGKAVDVEVGSVVLA